MSGRIPFGQGVPNRGTSEQWLDDWNQQMRSSSIYQNFMRRYGLPTDGRVRLSREQQGALEAELRAAGMQIPSGMHIDQGGNLNQKNRLARNVAIGAGVVGGGLAAAGAAGAGPLAGMFGGGSGAAGSAAAGAGFEGSIPGMLPGGTMASQAMGAGMSPALGAAGSAGSIAGYTPGWEGNTPGMLPGGSMAGREAAKGGLFGGLSAKDWAALGLTGVGTLGGMLSNPGNFDPNTATNDPQLQKLLATMQGRLDKSEPLYDSIMAMANGLLPTQYQKGGGGMG